MPSLLPTLPATHPTDLCLDAIQCTGGTERAEHAGISDDDTNMPVGETWF